MEYFAQALYTSLKELGIIEEKKLTEMFEMSKQFNTSFQENLLNADLISDVDLGRVVADLLQVPFIELASIQIPSSLVSLIPESFARKHQVIAFQETDHEVKLAMVDPKMHRIVRDQLEHKIQKKASVYPVTLRDFEKSLKIYKQNLQKSFDAMLKEQVGLVGKNGLSEPPIERIVDGLIEYAYDNGASDIHIEPEHDKSIVRFRIDGIMQEVLQFSHEIHMQVISRIKFLSKLRTDELFF